ncbi:unnamed protein product [Trichogramma brassicae]|uniref:Uncharacterized protein n=1 Tax=Trichogramma brassicae TaxID=86971 RepID=A0A6H5IVL8_9HYME|nr:unnamed protein product [Trichogramma brassicae]
MGPVEEGPMDAPTDPKHQSVDREEARRAELPPHAALDRAWLSLNTIADATTTIKARSMPGLPLIHRECGARVLSLPEVQRRKRETTLPALRGHDAGKHHQAHARDRERRAAEPAGADVGREARRAEPDGAWAAPDAANVSVHNGEGDYGENNCRSLALQGKGCQAPVFRGICDRDLGGQAGAVGRPYTWSWPVHSRQV